MDIDIDSLLENIEKKAMWVVASNGKRVLKDDLFLYENLLEIKNACSDDANYDDNYDIKCSVDEKKSIFFVDSNFMEAKSFIQFDSVEDSIYKDDIFIDDGFLKVTDISDFDFGKHDKGRKFYINSWLIDMNNKSDFSENFKNIMFKMIQFLAFYKSRDNGLNINFINKIENLIEQEDLTIEERKNLYDKLSYLTKFIEG